MRPLSYRIPDSLVIILCHKEKFNDKMGRLFGRAFFGVF